MSLLTQELTNFTFFLFIKIGRLVVATVAISDKTTIWLAVRPLIINLIPNQYTTINLIPNQYTTIKDKK